MRKAAAQMTLRSITCIACIDSDDDDKEKFYDALTEAVTENEAGSVVATTTSASNFKAFRLGFETLLK